MKAGDKVVWKVKRMSGTTIYRGVVQRVTRGMAAVVVTRDDGRRITLRVSQLWHDVPSTADRALALFAALPPNTPETL